MRFSEFAFLMIRSLNPEDYKALSTRKKRDTISYFLMLLVLSILIGFVFSIPKLLAVPEKIENTLMKFEKFNITGLDIEAKEPIVLLQLPKTVLDLTQNTTNITDEVVLITRSDIYWKKFRPSLFEWRLFETESKHVSEYSDVLQSAGKLSGGTYWLLLIIMLPSMFFAAFLLNFIKFTIIILLTTAIAYAAAKIKRKKTRLFTIWKVAVFSSTIMLLISIGLSPLFNLGPFFGLLPLILYLLIFYLAMLVISEKDINIKYSEDE